MKKVLFTLLAVIVIVGVLAGSGYAGYRIGYNQGATDSGNLPLFGRWGHMNPNLMPRFDGDFGYHMQPYGSPMMGRGNFGFFSLFRLLWNVAILALVVWFVYWLFTKSGWRIVRHMDKDREVPSKTEG